MISRNEKVFIDTSAIYALLNLKDENHTKAVNYYEILKKKNAIIITTNYIIDETYTLLMIRKGQEFAVDFIDKLRITFNIFYIEKTDDDQAIEILKKYIDKNFSFTDAVSFHIMKSNNIKTAFAFDKHFIQAGFKTLP